MPVTSVSSGRRRKLSNEERDQIVLEHLPLVKAIAIRVHESLPVHVDLDDLIHAGVLGLFDSVTRYDSDKNVAFQAYAKHRIKGAILDSLRQADWASRDMRKRQKKVDAATQELSAKLGRPPSENEMAEEMGVSVDRWRRMAMELRTQGLVAATPANEPERDLTSECPAAPDSQPDRMVCRRQLQIKLAHAMRVLPERYQKVVFLYYSNDLTMREIGDLIGVNESRVSQIHKTALRKMAMALESEGIRSAAAF
jgi:RNA polymerase sigma factor for flagellar operon FliA